MDICTKKTRYKLASNTQKPKNLNNKKKREHLLKAFNNQKLINMPSIIQIQHNRTTKIEADHKDKDFKAYPIQQSRPLSLNLSSSACLMKMTEANESYLLVAHPLFFHFVSEISDYFYSIQKV